jgi:hypothetical protein
MTANSPKEREVVNTVATPSLVKEASPSPVPRGHRAQNKGVMLAVGLGGIVVAGIALFTVVSTMNPHGSGQTTTARPAEVIRVGAAKPDEAIRVGAAKPDQAIRADAATPSPDSFNVPAPQGTIKRMDAISKAFSKQ